MSKNRNRTATKNCTQNRWYNIADFHWKFDPWDDYGYSWHHGNLPNHKWREFRTWKHNRKTQYKNETKTITLLGANG